MMIESDLLHVSPPRFFFDRFKKKFPKKATSTNFFCHHAVSPWLSTRFRDKETPMRIYGPVPSRRFGLSLGIDLVPHKTCSFDCVYCQLGPTDLLVTNRADFYELDDSLEDVKEALDKAPRPDVITFAGSGEPTLFKSLGPLIDRLHSLSDIPVLLITNSSLLWREEVAAAARKADILAPSLDAGDEETFLRVNRPHGDITYDRLIEGLGGVTRTHPGEVHLEVMLIRDINDDERSLQAIAKRLEDIRFDRIDINTPVRPPVPERDALPCDDRVLDRALELFGPKAHAIGSFEKRPPSKASHFRSFSDRDKDIREMLLRRPCTVSDIVSSLGLGRQAVIESLERLTKAGLVNSRSGQGDTYFHTENPNPTILNT
jgi:wyosine [tRNA(Phe)-imidazoG37] synthetase (radical SAM superfamily)